MKRIPHLRLLLPFLVMAASLQLTLGYYDPAAQRWINRDPLGDAGSVAYDQMPRPDSYVAYLRSQTEGNVDLFINNAPLTRIDPFGLQVWQGPGAPAPPNSTLPCNNCPPGQKSMQYWQANNYPSFSACVGDVGLNSYLAWLLGTGGLIGGGSGTVGGGIISVIIGGSLSYFEGVALITCMSQVCR